MRKISRAARPGEARGDGSPAIVVPYVLQPVLNRTGLAVGRGH